MKLLDFGLARAAAVAATAGDDAATVAYSMADAEVIAGTPAYMAPEQARGLPLDKRADIWAFGVVLYEMLTGTALYKGATVTDIMAAVVREEPDLSGVPASVQPVLRRCLEKDPKRRLRDVGDAVLLLESAKDAPVAGTGPRGLRVWLPWAAAAVALVAFAGLLAVHLRETPPVANTVRFKITLPSELTVQQTTPFAVSGDGRALVFPAVGADGVSRLWLQEFNAIEPRVLAGTESNGGMLGWLHDNRSILYSQGLKLKRVDISGGPPTELGDVPQPGFGFTMSPDGVFVYGTPEGLVRVDTLGAKPTLITKATPDALHAPVQFLPDRKRVLYGRGGAPGSRAVYVASIDAAPDAQPKDPILKTDFFAWFVPTRASDSEGELLTVRENTLIAQRFDSGSLQLKGEPRPIGENVFVVNNASGFGLAFYTVSEEGTLVYRTGTLADRLSRQLAVIGRDGQTQKTFAELGRFNQVKLSPDGKKVVTSRTELETGNFADLWITDLDTETSTKFTFGGGANVQPVWSPDGRSIAWARSREKDMVLYRKSADGAGPEEELVTLPERRNVNMSDWTSDGAFLIYSYGGDVFALPMTGVDRKPIPIAATKATEFGAAVSPNRRWIAYISNESSRQEVYVQPFAPGSTGAPAGKWLVSRGTSGLIRWRSDSGELVFLSPDGELMSVDVSARYPSSRTARQRRCSRCRAPFWCRQATRGRSPTHRAICSG